MTAPTILFEKDVAWKLGINSHKIMMGTNTMAMDLTNITSRAFNYLNRKSRSASVGPKAAYKNYIVRVGVIIGFKITPIHVPPQK